MNKPKILCTGAPRSGTSLFNLLMSHFKDLRVCTESGTPKDLFSRFDVFSSQQRPDGKLWNNYLGGGKKLSFMDILNEGTKLIVIYRDGRDCFVSARQSRPEDIEEKIKKIRAEGVAGSNSIKVILDGEGEMQKIEISDELLKEDKTIIEDLIVAAHNNAKHQLKNKTSEEISKATGGFGIPGFKWPL